MISFSRSDGMGRSVRVRGGGAGVLAWSINICMEELEVNTSWPVRSQ
jgi:hypothetical protein